MVCVKEGRWTELAQGLTYIEWPHMWFDSTRGPACVIALGKGGEKRSLVVCMKAMRVPVQTSHIMAHSGVLMGPKVQCGGAEKVKRRAGLPSPAAGEGSIPT